MTICGKKLAFYCKKIIKYIVDTRCTLLFITTLILAALTPCTEAAENKYKETIVTQGGHITGTISLDGDVPPEKFLYVDKDIEHCGEVRKPSPVLQINPANKGIKNVVVSIENISEGKPFDTPSIRTLLDQQNCMFIPHVLVITTSSTVDILNGDNVLHNVHSHCIKNPPFNLGTTYKQRLSRKFDFVETIKITCDVHNWMSAWIVVKSNPYFAVTDAKGRFFIDDRPPGTYTLQAWHESLGVSTKEVNVNPNEKTKVNFLFSQEELN